MTKTAPEIVRTDVEAVKSVPLEGAKPVQKVVINQEQAAPVAQTNTQQTGRQQDADKPITQAAPTGDTGGGTDSGASDSAKTNTQPENTEAAPQQKPQVDGMQVDELSKLSEKELEETLKDYKEKGFDVDEIKRKVDIAKQTGGNDDGKDIGRDEAAKVKGLMPDPDWGKPLDEKFDIQQGDFIEFLMKDVILASAAWTGNKVTGSLGYGAYRAGSWAWHSSGDFMKKHWDKHKEASRKADEDQKSLHKKMVEDNILPQAVKSEDLCGSTAQITLDLRRRMIDKILQDKQLKQAKELNNMAAAVTRGDATFGENNMVTYSYQDADGKTHKQSGKLTDTDYQQLKTLDQVVTSQVASNPDIKGDAGKEKEFREMISAQHLAQFQQMSLMREQALLYAANYTTAKFIEQARGLAPDEVKKFAKTINKTFPDVAFGEAMVSFYKQIEDINHLKDGAIKGDDKTSAATAVVNASEAAVRESVTKINKGDYKEALDKEGKGEHSQNESFRKIELSGESEYAPGIKDMTKEQQEVALNYMHKDAVNGYIRYDALTKENDAKQKEISAFEADKESNDDKRKRVKQLKQDIKTGTQEHQKTNENRDANRTTQFANIKAGIVK